MERLNAFCVVLCLYVLHVSHRVTGGKGRAMQLRRLLLLINLVKYPPGMSRLLPFIGLNNYKSSLA